MGVWLYFLTFAAEPQNSFKSIWFFIIAFLTLPVVGLYYSLKRNNFFGALLFTVLMGLALPVFIYSELAFLIVSLNIAGSRSGELDWQILLLAVLQILVAAVTGFHLHHDLVRRKFPLQRAVT